MEFERRGSAPGRGKVLPKQGKTSVPAVLSFEILEKIRSRFNRREFVHPDPLEFLYRYENEDDREIAALVASSLAFGNVRQILRNAGRALEIMESPRLFLETVSARKMTRLFAGFKHRWIDGEAMVLLLKGCRRILEDHGTMGRAFLSMVRPGDRNVVGALAAFSRGLCSGGLPAGLGFIPSPETGSACKRLNLMLRWLVRRDEVDPGGWEGVGASRLIVPLDVHMHRAARILGLTSRVSADLKAALEITGGFARFSPSDPVKYDFALTRIGIRKEGDLLEFCY